MSIAKKVLKNTMFGALGRVWLILVGFLLTPLILSYLGNERFALWAIFWSVTAYIMLMDLGMGVSLVRQVAQSLEKQEYTRINQAVVSVLLLMLCIATVAWAFVWALSVWFLPVAGVSSVVQQDILHLVTWGPLVFLLIALLRVFDAVLRGLQRFDLILGVTLATSVVNVLGIYFTLSWGLGVLGLMWATVASYAFQMLALYAWTKKTLPQFSTCHHHFNYPLLKSMLPLGARIQVAKVAELASYQTDKLLLAFFMPLSFVTFYDLGSKIAGMMRDAVYTFTTAIFPVASQIQASGDHGRLWLLYERGSKYLLMFSLPALAMLLLTAPMLIGAWLGHVSDFVLQAVWVLGVAYWVIVSMAMAFNVGTALNWSKPIMRGSVLQAVLNVSLSAVLISQIGFMGALWGTLLAVAVSKVYVMRCFYRDFERSIWDDTRLFLHVLLSNLPSVFLSLPLVMWLGEQLDFNQREDAALAWFVSVVVYTLVYLVSIRAFRLLDAKDMDMLGSHIPGLRYLVKKA